MVPTDAEEVLSLLRRSITEALKAGSRGAGRRGSPVYFAGESPAEPEGRAARKMQSAVDAAQSFGSVPPSPSTLRARLALSLMRLLNRALWWHTAVSKRFANAICEITQVQLEEQETQQQNMIDLEERLRAVEQALRRLERPRQPGDGDRA